MNKVKKLLHKIKANVELWVYSFIRGMKNTEDIILRQDGTDSGGDTDIHKQVEDNRMSKALLRGEVTTEVEELRYRVYKVDKESKNYEYVVPTLALKNIERKKGKYFVYDDSDGLELITSQSNDVVYDGINHIINEIEKVGDNKTVVIDDKYRLEIDRGNNYIARYKIEKYVSRIDIKKIDDLHAIIELYIPTEPKEKNFKWYGLLGELKSFMEGKQQRRGDIFDIYRLSFITHNAYGLNDGIKFIFDNIFFQNIKIFDGSYIVRLKGKIAYDVIDFTEKYYSKSMDEKYKNKEKKETTFNLGEYMAVESYVCEKCGKEVLMSRKEIDELEPSKPRLITEENDEEESNVLEFEDMRLSEATFGMRLCSKCLHEMLENDKTLTYKGVN